MTEPVLPKEELEATLEARRELGAEMESHVIDGFVERVGKQIDQRIDRRIDERLRAQKPRERITGNELGLITLTLAFAIPLLAIAGGTAGLPGVIAVSVALVLINVIARR